MWGDGGDGEYVHPFKIYFIIDLSFSSCMFSCYVVQLVGTIYRHFE